MKTWVKWLLIAVVVLLAVATAFLVPTLRWYRGFNERLRLADEHAPVLRRVLEADPRFSQIEVESFTGNNGCLLVSAVAKPGAAQDLKRLVESTSPPVPIKYHVYESDSGVPGNVVDLSSR